jgi:hypothetical protein
MTDDRRLVILRMLLVASALLATACATKTLPRRIPVATALPPPETGVVFDVRPVMVGADADWEVHLDGGSGLVVITPRQIPGVAVAFGEHTVRGTVIVFETHAVTSTVKTANGTQSYTTFVRSPVARCEATLDVAVSYIEPRRVEVDVARQNCAIREVEVSAY